MAEIGRLDENAALRLQMLGFPVVIWLAIMKGNSGTISDCAKRLDRLQKVYESMENIDEGHRNHIIAEIMSTWRA